MKTSSEHLIIVDQGICEL